jgi:hypothetical protein
MGEFQNILHALVGVIGALVGGVLAALPLKIRQVVDPTGTLQAASSSPTASELELERHHGWSGRRIMALVLLLAGAVVLVFTWRTPQVRVIVAAALFAACAVVPVAMQPLLLKEFNKGFFVGLTSFPMLAALICGFVSAYIVSPELPLPSNAVSSNPVAVTTPQPSPAPSSFIVSSSPDASSVAITPSPDSSSTAPSPSTESTAPTIEPATPQPTEEEALARLRADLAAKGAPKRLGAFKNAIDSGDDAQRATAVETALKSPYTDLRALAVAGAMRSAGSFIVHIKHAESDSDSTALLEKIGRDIEVQIADYDKSKNIFIASTSASGVVATVGGPPFPHNRPSYISGKRLSFSFDIARVVPGSGCTGVALLAGAAGNMTGTMHCSGNYTANYSIEIDIGNE